MDARKLIYGKELSRDGKSIVKFVGMRPHSDYVRIANMPTVLNNTHESVYRAGGILRKVKELLEQGVPGAVVMDLIYLMETDTVEILEADEET